MLTNATLISYATPDVPSPRGGVTPGTATAYAAGTRCFVDRPARSRQAYTVDQLADVKAMALVPMHVVPRPELGGHVTYRLDGEAESRVLQAAAVTPLSHGLQSHYEILLRPVR